MIKMKKILTAALACALVLTVTACSSNSTTGGNTSGGGNNISESTNYGAASDTASDDNSGANDTSDTQSGGDDVSEPANDGEKKFAHGTWNGSTYTSEFIGIKAEFGSDWSIADDDTLMQLTGITEISEETVKSGKPVTDMMVSNSNSDSVNINIQNIKASGIDLTEDQFIELAVEATNSQYKALGFDATPTTGTGTIGGRTAKTIGYTVTMEDVTIEQLQYVIFDGDYAIAITLTTAPESEYTVDDMASWFEAAV